jgi:hypothetical protein
MFRDTRPGPDYVSPARAASVASDVLVPLLQAAVTGVIAGLIGLLVILATGWAWWLPLVIALVTFALIWLRLMQEHNEHLWIKEWHEQQAAPPAEIHHITRLTVQVDGGRMVETEIDLPHDVMLKIARGVVNAGRPFSEREWSGQGRLLSSPAEFRALRDKLLDMDFLRWKDDQRRNLGVEWTPEGWAMLQQLAGGAVVVEGVVRNG